MLGSKPNNGYGDQWDQKVNVVMSELLNKSKIRGSLSILAKPLVEQ